jgi:hypothetical protein
MIKRAVLPILAAVLIACGSSTALADPTGTFAVIDGGSPSVAPGTDITAATSFTIGDLTHLSGNSTTGIFELAPGVPPGSGTGAVQMPAQDFGSVTFTNAGGANSTFSIGPLAYFGSFTSTSITETQSTMGANSTVSLFILGNWTAGTAFSPSGPFPASFTISFTQDGGPTASISDSGTFAVPPDFTSVPEPSSFVLLGLGAIGFVGYRWFSRVCA